MKLNEEWDQVYRSATLGLQHRLEALELENAAIKQLNSRLLLKVDHQQVNIQLSSHGGNRCADAGTVTTLQSRWRQCIRDLLNSEWCYSCWVYLYMCVASCCVLVCRVQKSTMSRRWCKSWRRTRSCRSTSDCWKTGCIMQIKTARLPKR